MTAAVGDIFRAQNAELFLNDFSVNNYYMLIGDQVPYDPLIFGVGASDLNVPQATSYVNATYDLWRGSYGAKRIYSSDVVPCIRNVQWTSGVIYSQYDAYDTAYSLENFYVVTTDFNVYKVLSNNGNSASTTMPTGTGSSVIITADNYRWKYMYSISAGQAQKFSTASFIPVYTVASNNLSAGSLESFRLTNGGTNYPANTTIAVVITGDGAGAAANAYTNGSGVVTHIEPTTGGSGYTYAYAILPAPDTVPGGSTGTTATALPNISPVGGHGFNNINELFARYAMVQVQFVYGESGNISTATSFRQVALVRNPTLYGSTAIASAASYRQTYILTLTSTSGAFAPGDLVQNVSATHVGYVVEVDGTTLYVNMVKGIFTNEFIQKSDSSASGTITSITTPELEPFSGNLFYYEDRSPVTRAINQIETVFVVFEY